MGGRFSVLSPAGLFPAAAAGIDIGEIAIPTHYGDEISYLNPLRYGLRTLHVMWRFRRGHYD